MRYTSFNYFFVYASYLYPHMCHWEKREHFGVFWIIIIIIDVREFSCRVVSGPLTPPPHPPDALKNVSSSLLVFVSMCVGECKSCSYLRVYALKYKTKYLIHGHDDFDLKFEYVVVRVHHYLRMRSYQPQ